MKFFKILLILTIVIGFQSTSIAQNDKSGENMSSEKPSVDKPDTGICEDVGEVAGAMVGAAICSEAGPAVKAGCEVAGSKIGGKIGKAVCGKPSKPEKPSKPNVEEHDYDAGESYREAKFKQDEDYHKSSNEYWEKIRVNTPSSSTPASNGITSNSPDYQEYKQIEIEIRNKNESQINTQNHSYNLREAKTAVHASLNEKNPFLAEMTVALVNDEELKSVASGTSSNYYEIHNKVLDLYSEKYATLSDLNWDKIESEIQLSYKEKEHILANLRMNRINEVDKYLNQLYTNKTTKTTTKTTTKKQNCKRRGEAPSDQEDNFFNN